MAEDKEETTPSETEQDTQQAETAEDKQETTPSETEQDAQQAETAEDKQETTPSETEKDAEQAERDKRTAKNIVAVEDAGPCKKKVSIEIPEETIRELADKQYQELRREALVPGFRKGRAPRRLLERRFGKETNEQVKLKLLAEASEAAIKAHELDILGDPEIDHEHLELPETGPMRFEFEAEVRPELELPPLEGIAVTRPKLEVTDEQVDREIKQLRRWSGVWTPREDGAVELDDQIIADVRLHVELTDEEKTRQDAEVEGTAEPQEAEQGPIPDTETKLDNTELYVRPNGFVGPIPIEKLDELLIGAKAGDKKTTTTEIPETFFREEFQGRTVDVQIDIKDVKFLKLAEMNEPFLQRYEAESVEELHDKIRDNLQERLETRIRSDMQEQIYQHLLDNTDFELPMDIVARHTGSLLQRQYINLLSRGLSQQQIDEQMEQLRAASEEQARQQLKTFFLMDKVAEKLDIEVSDEEVNGHIAQVAVQRSQRPEKLREQMERDGSLAQFRLDVRQQKCIDKLLETAAVTAQEPEPEPKAKKKPKKARKKAAPKQAEEQDQ